MILDRIDPDLVHPARLAAHRGWAAWGLTRPSNADTDVVLLVPAHAADRLVPDIVRRVADTLQRPAWPPSDTTITVATDRIHLRSGEVTTTLAVTSHPWYPPKNSTSAPGEVVGRDRWPVIEEATALRERLEAIDRTQPTAVEVTDISNWIATKATQARDYPFAAPITTLLTGLRRDAPTAYANVHHVIECARNNYAQLPNRDRVAATFQILTHELASIERGRRR